MTRPWTGIVGKEEERRFLGAGFGRPGGLGADWIDVYYAHRIDTETPPEP